MKKMRIYKVRYNNGREIEEDFVEADSWEEEQGSGNILFYSYEFEVLAMFTDVISIKVVTEQKLIVPTVLVKNKENFEVPFLFPRSIEDTRRIGGEKGCGPRRRGRN